MARELQPCGTRAAYVRHLRHDEKPCAECRAANSGATQAFEPQPCGTAAAAKRHRKKGEPVCDACREAERLIQREPDRARVGRARGRAFVVLSRRYPEEFAEILEKEIAADRGGRGGDQS
jgi:hypothetical protein